MSQPERRLGHIAFLALAIVWTIPSLQYRYGSLLDPGPGFLPLNLGVVMAAISAWGLFGALRTPPSNGAAEVDGSEGETAPVMADRALIRKVTVTVLATLGFLILLRPIGYGPAMLGLLTTYFAIGGMAFFRALLWGAVGTVATWVLFEVLLGLPLPGDILDSIVGL
ncbi:MAG: hypothetical protein GEU79_06570 [Acidimicrobiia bacterium]|nr:hypothetical protein [Acidimicrobiia bacterium]